MRFVITLDLSCELFYADIHLQINEIRLKAATMSKSARSTFFNAMGMREESSWLVRRLSPSLDTIRSVPADPPYACRQGQVRMSRNILIKYILNPDQHGAYSKAFSSCPMPPGWKRIQNPIRHRGSWDLSEQARACVITAIILRTWLSDTKMRPEIVAAVQHDPQSPPFADFITASSVITSIFCQMSCVYGYVTRHQLSRQDIDMMYGCTIEARRQFVRLVRIVVSASKKLGPLQRLQTAEQKPLMTWKTIR
jgi:hypothetical protein